MQDDQLQTLVAVADEGTFEAAARRLRITPSAVSQRIRALERAAGAVVVQRSSPVRPTAAGEILLRLGRQRAVLENEAMDQLGLRDGGVEELTVAINADSLATWFSAVLAEVASWPDVALRLRVEDQAHSSTLLRSGAVVAAVTADPVAVQGCSVTPLVRMRYLPVCTPELRERHRHGRGVDLAAMPSVRFNDRDDLQVALLRARGIDRSAVVHEVPSSESFVAAVATGLGWGMVPVAQARQLLDSGALVPVLRDHLDVQLYWQAWRLRTERLDRLTRAVSEASAGRLS
ncbi:LysR family transcriptional regulator ArgP [Flexivirga oryzae]|uniref:LysR family transcriptional regulator (Chromosome initiation inhibitor) n=1 Tax=Flexivirga oryzae TaxID=1794944 RepID=A0A839N4S5_9MICO|nr:LysR family transcriptional regulator ArgP [Flexivirga oryzae]MBB2892307.1 LysR family transcriptional regulator (chromosome initiation inhibitor) [Flexivirga oryzae]